MLSDLNKEGNEVNSLSDHGQLEIIPERRYLVKVGVRKINQVTDISQIFKVTQTYKKMTELEEAKEYQNAYLERIAKDGGDFHYFKKQTFSLVYRKTNKNGVLTPQGELDEDPVKFFNDNFDKEDMVYNSLANVNTRKGEKKSWHFKVFLKERFLKPLVLEAIQNEPSYIPVPGKILSYQKFYAMVCRGNNMKRRIDILEKEKKSIAKNNDIQQIDKLEKEAVRLLEERIDLKREEIKSRQSQLESTMCHSAKSSAELENFELAKKTLEFELSQINKEFVQAKNDLTKYYESISDIRVEYELEKSQIAEAKNAKKRKRRIEEKFQRQIIDPELANPDSPSALESTNSSDPLTTPITSAAVALNINNDKDLAEQSVVPVLHFTLRSQSNDMEEDTQQQQEHKEKVRNISENLGIGAYSSSTDSPQETVETVATADDNDSTSNYKPEDDNNNTTIDST